jgi:hypothetical protein
MKTIERVRTAMTLGLLIAAAAGIYSCKDSTTSVSNPDEIVFPSKNISYYRTVQPLFNITCATGSCHDQQTRASNLDLSSYSGLRTRFYDVVIPHDTLNSRLIWSVEGRPGSSPMPPYRPLNLNQVQGLKRWISEGATDTIP